MINCQHKPNKNICKLCGITIYKDKSVAYKHNSFKSH